MNTLSVIMNEHLSGDTSHEVGKVYDFPIDEAIRLINAGISKPKNKKEYEQAILYIADEENKKLEKEKQIAAIQYSDELLDEKHKLQERINAINEILKIEEISIIIDSSDESKIKAQDIAARFEALAKKQGDEEK
jgi:hypothetical protein